MRKKPYKQMFGIFPYAAAVLAAVLFSALSADAETEALVCRGPAGVEKYSVVGGEWKPAGVWGGEEAKSAVAAAPVADRVVVALVSKKGGLLKEFSREGLFKGVIADLDFTPVSIIAHSNRKRVFISGTDRSVRVCELETKKVNRFIADAGVCAGLALTLRGEVASVAPGAVSGKIWSFGETGEAGCCGLWKTRGAVLNGSLAVDYETGDFYAAAVGGISSFGLMSHTVAYHPLAIGADAAVVRVDRRLWAIDPACGAVFEFDPVKKTAKRAAGSVKGARSVCDLNGVASMKGLQEDYWPAMNQFCFSRAAPANPKQWVNSATDFERLEYRSPGAMDITAGLIGIVYVLDFDGDGDKDLIVSSGGVPAMQGTWFFENPTPLEKKENLPIFKAPVRLGDGYWNSSVQALADGSVVATLPGAYTFTFKERGFRDMKAFNGLSPSIRDNPVRCNLWRLADFDGDGRDDLFISTGDWRQYGWQNAFDSRGNWINGWVRGNFYWVKNLGGSLKDGTDRWGNPELLRDEAQEPLETDANPFGMLADFDGDGDLDIIATTYRDDYYWFENTGTRTKPVYQPGRILRGSDGKRLHGDLCIQSPVAVDWDDDGLMDIIASEEDGRTGWLRNTGKVVNGMPVFDQPVYFRQEKTGVNLGCLASPFGVDWDDDGDMDLIVGNSAGYIAFVENLSGPGFEKPSWADPVFLTAPESPFEHRFRDDVSFARGKTGADAPIHIQAGHNGSIQGPVEGKWGYTCFSVADWDGDGLKDIMVNSIWGEIVWFKNIGTRGKPRLAAAAPVEVEWRGAQPTLKWGWNKPCGRKGIITQWRTTPVMTDLNGDGLMDLLLVDTDGDLAFWERAKDKDGRLYLKPPRKAILNANGSVMHPTCKLDPKAWMGGIGGPTGRRKICMCDWDGDGKPDLVMNSQNACVYRQIKHENGCWYFNGAEDLGNRTLAGHSSCPTAVDFDGDGIADLVVGSDDGFLYYLKNPRRVLWEQGKNR